MNSKIPSIPLTVGSVSSLEALEAIDSDHTPQFDVLEIRLDGIPKENIDDAHWVALRIKSWGMPILITARDTSEGGIIKLTIEERTARLNRFSELASYFDIEIANYPEFKDIANELQARGIKMVLSSHYFESMPNCVQDEIEKAQDYGADITKFAMMLESPKDLLTCVELVQQSSTLISVMGMGPMAPVSRLLCAQHGSVLNYGYLGDTPTAPGQWSAGLLKKAISASELLG